MKNALPPQVPERELERVAQLQFHRVVDALAAIVDGLAEVGVAAVPPSMPAEDRQKLGVLAVAQLSRSGAPNFATWLGDSFSRLATDGKDLDAAAASQLLDEVLEVAGRVRYRKHPRPSRQAARETRT